MSFRISTSFTFCSVSFAVLYMASASYREACSGSLSFRICPGDGTRSAVTSASLLNDARRLTNRQISENNLSGNILIHDFFKIIMIFSEVDPADILHANSLFNCCGKCRQPVSSRKLIVECIRQLLLNLSGSSHPPAPASETVSDIGSH